MDVSTDGAAPIVFRREYVRRDGDSVRPFSVELAAPRREFRDGEPSGLLVAELRIVGLGVKLDGESAAVVRYDANDDVVRHDVHGYDVLGCVLLAVQALRAFLAPHAADIRVPEFTYWGDLWLPLVLPLVPFAPPDLEERVLDLVDETIAESNRRMETDPAYLRAARMRAGIPPEGYGGTLRD